jgi:hypothetical protein
MKMIDRRIETTFQQEVDCCKDGDLENLITIKVCNGGTTIEDNYVVIETERWAVDSGDELRKLADEIDKILTECKK